MSPDLINKKGNKPPPQQCTPENRGISENIMVVTKFWQQKIKPCKQAYDEKQDQRIGKREKKSGAEILPECVWRRIRLFVGFFLNRYKANAISTTLPIT